LANRHISNATKVLALTKNHVVLTFFFLAQGAAAQVLESGDPAKNGFNSARLERIDYVLSEEIEAGKFSGAVALVARHGDVIYHQSFGYADIASRKPMQKNSIFRIASMTKAITSVGIMMLYEQGRFQLNDPVSRFIPAFADPRVVDSVDDAGNIIETRAAASEIKIVDLLSHSSGIGYSFISSDVQKTYVEAGILDGLTAKNVKLASTMNALGELPLLFDPGERFEYGLNTDVLGYLIEIVSGKSLDRYFAEEIFEPLGMSDTYFYLPDDRKDRLVTLYADVDGLRVSEGNESDIKLDNPDYPIEGARSYFSGGAGLSSTAYDYARFIQMLLNDGELDGKRLLGRKSVELMRTPRIDWDDDGDGDFGLGFVVNGDLGGSGEIGSLGMYGWGGAFNTVFWIDPAEDLIAVLMTQVRPTTSDIRDRFRTLVYQALD
jgi:CubicO group peptidase (beta-lactamase class C family)